MKDIKIGFLGYCDIFIIITSTRFHYTCPMRQGDSKAGPAMYSDENATRDVKALKVRLALKTKQCGNLEVLNRHGVNVYT